MKENIKKLAESAKYLYKRLVLRRKIALIYNKIKNSGAIFSDRGTNLNHLDYWGSFGRINLQWFKVYNYLTQMDSPEFIPENIYYTKIEPKLNYNRVSFAYTDKNFYELRYQNISFPLTIIRNIEGVFYNRDYCYLEMNESEFQKLIDKYDCIIIKPSLDSGGGQNVKLFFRDNGVLKEKYSGEILSLEYLGIHYLRNYLIQEFLEQDSFFSQLNRSSLNTVRILTYRSIVDNSIHPVNYVLRIGRPGSVTDNQAAGGIAWGIKANGVLGDYGVDKLGTKYTTVENYQLKGLVIPKWDDFLNVSCEAAKHFFYDRLLGVDLCLDQTGAIRVVEVNNNSNEINFFQMTNGPLLGRFTKEVIEYCKSV